MTKNSYVAEATFNILLLLPSIVSYNEICVFIMIFTALSFLRLIYYMRVSVRLYVIET